MRVVLAVMAVAFGCAGRAAAADPATFQVNRVAGDRLVEMFKAGFEPGANHLTQARRHYDLALSATNGDPRIDYALGLVLVKQMKYREAAVQFQSVARQSKIEFWPAWQGLIWVHLVMKDYSAGHERLKDYARRIADPRSAADQEERQRSAEWIGQVVAALQKSVDTVKQRETLLRLNESLNEILGPALQVSLERGKLGVHNLHSLMEEDVQQSREAEQARLQKERAENEARLAESLEVSAEKREALKKSADDARKVLDAQLAAFDKQLTRLERDYEFLQKRALSITASQVNLNAEVALLEQQRPNNSRSHNAGAVGRDREYQQLKAGLDVQSLKYQVELDQTMAGAYVVAQRAQAVVGQRIAAVRRYERATGLLVRQDSRLNQWQDRLKRGGEKLKGPANGKPAVVAARIQQARSFRTYVELDLALERDRLLDLFGAAMSEFEPAKSPNP